jgi:phosphonate degradation associated HDIG domain protein
VSDEIPSHEFVDPELFVAKLFDYLEAKGSGSYFDSEVTQLEHALQSANLARQARACDALVAAALLHDIGHLLLDEQKRQPNFLSADLRHEAVGAELLAHWFTPAVTAPVALHVSAKRYLVAVDPAYRNSLSTASEQSLLAQGGPFSSEEAEQFARLAFAEDAVCLRRCDDLAKISAKVVPPLREYAGMIAGLVRIEP